MNVEYIFLDFMFVVKFGTKYLKVKRLAHAR